MNRLLSVAILGLSLALGSCGDASAPSEREGAVVVRAYVDRDASGTLTTGADSMISNFQVALVRDGAEAATLTTGPDGTAIAGNLRPGTYQVVVKSGAPSGAALLTNPSPTAVVSFRGDTTRIDFRFAFFPGTISGRLYIDDGNTPGVYDSGDTPGAGIAVYLRTNEGGVAGDTVKTTVTDDSGRYVFTLLAPGTYFVEFENPGSLDFGASGAVRQVTVVGQQATAEDAIVTGSLTIPIERARSRPAGTRVTVRGNVTARPGSFTSGTGGVNSEIWIQDATGGIAVFSVPTADSATYRLGDLLEVRGTTGAFSGQKQIANPDLVVTEIGGNTLVAPKRLTGTEVNAKTDDGELVVVDSVQVTTVATGTASSFNVTGTTRDGQTITLRITGPTTTQQNTGLTRGDFVVGSFYNVTGILTQNNNVAQIKPRMRSDVVVPLDPNSIAAIRLLPAGQTVTIRGNVTARPGTFTSGTGGVNSEIWIQDASGGIAVFSVPTSDSLTYAIGDLLEVTGTTGAFSGQKQIANPGLTVTELGGSTIRAAKPLTGLQANSLADDGSLVVVDSIQVVTVATGTATSFNVTGTTRDGQTITLRIIGPTTTQQNTGLTRADFVVGSFYHVTGILTQFNGTAQIKPRRRSDVVLATSAPPPPPPPVLGVRFSEIHYDNAGTDSSEAIEVAGPAGTDLTGWQIVLYNGSATSLSTYDTKTLSGAIPGTCGSRGVIVQAYPSNGIQNGDPDGFALVNPNGVVVEFLSYEGTFTAANGPAAGMTSTDIGAREDNATTAVGQSLQRIADGTWTGPITNTFGACNDI